MMKNYFKFLTIVAIGLLFSGNVQSQIVKGGDCATGDAVKWTIVGKSESVTNITFGNDTVPTGASSVTSAKIVFPTVKWTETQMWQKVSLKADVTYSLNAKILAKDHNHKYKWLQAYVLDPSVEPDENGYFADGTYPGRDTVKYLSLSAWIEVDTTFTIDGDFPRDGDYGKCAETFTAEVAGNYTLLFKFGGEITETVYLTDISIVEKTGGTGINSTKTTSNLTVYPTSAQNTLNIGGVENSAIVSIYSVSGSMVANFQDITNEVNVTGLTSGMYFVRVVEGSDEIVKKVIIK